MFEREIQYITDFTLNKVRRLGSFFKLADLREQQIHPAILQYITAELDYLIFLDRQRLLNKSLFDYYGETIARHFNEIAVEIKKNKLLPYEEIRKTVQLAVSFNVNYLLRPRWTLRKFIFDQDDYKSADELRLLLNYSHYYGYYKNFVIRLLEKHALTSLSATEFSERINLLTKELLQAQFNPVISAALDDSVSFITLGDAVKSRLSLEMVEVFLTDRKLEDMSAVLRLRLSADMKQKYDIEEIKSIILTSYLPGQMEFDFDADDRIANPEDLLSEPEKIFSVREEQPLDEITIPELDIDKYFQEPERPGEPPAPEPADALVEAALDAEVLPGESVTEEVSAPSGLEIPADVEEHIEEEVPSDVILEEIRKANDILKITLPEVIESTETVTEPVEAESPPDLFDAANGDIMSGQEEVPEIEEIIAQPLEESIPELVSAPPPEEETAAADTELFNYFTTKETMKIVASVFRNDSIDFINSIERIASCKNFDDAQSILRSIYYAYHISSVNNPEAQLLEDRVQKFFNS